MSIVIDCDKDVTEAWRTNILDKDLSASTVKLISAVNSQAIMRFLTILLLQDTSVGLVDVTMPLDSAQDLYVLGPAFRMGKTFRLVVNGLTFLGEYKRLTILNGVTELEDPSLALIKEMVAVSLSASEINTVRVRGECPKEIFGMRLQRLEIIEDKTEVGTDAIEFHAAYVRGNVSRIFRNGDENVGWAIDRMMRDPEEVCVLNVWYDRPDRVFQAKRALEHFRFKTEYRLDSLVVHAVGTEGVEQVGFWLTLPNVIEITVTDRDAEAQIKALKGGERVRF